MENSSKLTSKLFWFVMTCLGVFMILRGLWSLFQPWGVVEEKIFGLIFFTILFLVSLYGFLCSMKVASKNIATNVSRNLVSALGSLAFVAGGIFIFAKGDSSEKLLGLSTIAFFGFCSIVFLRRVYLERQE